MAAEVDIARALVREVLVEPAADVERRWRERYLPSQQLYDVEVQPQEVADVVVNDDPQQHRWRFRVPEVCATALTAPGQQDHET